MLLVPSTALHLLSLLISPSAAPSLVQPTVSALWLLLLVIRPFRGASLGRTSTFHGLVNHGDLLSHFLDVLSVVLVATIVVIHDHDGRGLLWVVDYHGFGLTDIDQALERVLLLALLVLHVCLRIRCASVPSTLPLVDNMSLLVLPVLVVDLR